MTHTDQLFRLLPTSTESPYLRGSLHHIFRELFNGSNAGFKPNDFVTDKDVFFVCQAALGNQHVRQRRELLVAEVQTERSAQAAQRIASLKLAEQQTHATRISLQALHIASGVAQFVEEPRTPKAVKHIYLPLCSQEAVDIYDGVWQHLGAYAAELNLLADGAEGSVAARFDHNLSGAASLELAAAAGTPVQLAQLQDVGIFGDLQGTINTPIGIDLRLQQLPVARHLRLLT